MYVVRLIRGSLETKEWIHASNMGALARLDALTDLHRVGYKRYDGRDVDVDGTIVKDVTVFEIDATDWYSGRCGQFVERFVEILSSEHGTPISMFDDYRPLLRKVYDDEGHITPKEMFELICGSEEGEVPPDLKTRFPKLDAIACRPFLNEEDLEDL